MEETDETRKRRPRPPLPLSEEDLTAVMEEHSTEGTESASPFWRAVLSIVLAAPVAAFLVLIIIDIYPTFALKTGLREPPPISAPAMPAEPEPKKEDKQLEKLIKAFEKSNRALVKAISKQTGAVLKLAEKKPDVIKVEAPKIEKIEVKVPKQAAPGQNVERQAAAPPKIIVVKVPSGEKFDLEYEKRKILELANVDLDDPVTGPDVFQDVKSRDVLKEIIRSLNAIIAAARDHEEVSDFLKSNALEAKKRAVKRLSELK